MKISFDIVLSWLLLVYGSMGIFVACFSKVHVPISELMVYLIFCTWFPYLAAYGLSLSKTLLVIPALIVFLSVSVRNLSEGFWLIYQPPISWAFVIDQYDSFGIYLIDFIAIGFFLALVKFCLSAKQTK